MNHLRFFTDEKYTILDTRSSGGYLPPAAHESSFKHYSDGLENGPEVINVTSSAGNTLLRPDSRGLVGAHHDLGTTSLRSASSLAALNNGGGGTLPRSSLIRNYAHGHGTLKKSADELRPLTADGHYLGHVHKPSMDTLRRVHFEKSATPSAASSSNATDNPAVVSNPVVLTSVAPPTTTSVIASTTIDQPDTVVVTTAASTLSPPAASKSSDLPKPDHSHSSLNHNGHSHSNPVDDDEGDTAM